MRKITIKIYWFLACMLALTGLSCKEEPALEIYADDVSQLNDFPTGLPEVASDIQYVCFAGGLQYMEEFVIFNHCHPINRIEKSKHEVLMPTKNTG